MSIWHSLYFLDHALNLFQTSACRINWAIFIMISFCYVCKYWLNCLSIFVSAAVCSMQMDIDQPAFSGHVEVKGVVMLGGLYRYKIRGCTNWNALLLNVRVNSCSVLHMIYWTASTIFCCMAGIFTIQCHGPHSLCNNNNKEKLVSLSVKTSEKWWVSR